jgi:RNA polymerase sigma factor (sigma-70 family)
LIICSPLCFRPQQIPATANIPETLLAQRQLLEALDAAISGLSQRQQHVFVLDRLHGWRQAEIAAHLGISLSTVQKELKIAMALCVAVQQRLEVK